MTPLLVARAGSRSAALIRCTASISHRRVRWGAHLEVEEEALVWTRQWLRRLNIWAERTTGSVRKRESHCAKNGLGGEVGFRADSEPGKVLGRKVDRAVVLSVSRQLRSSWKRRDGL